MKWVRNISIIVLVLVASNLVHGQRLTAIAYDYLQAEKIDSARYWIDSAIVTDERKNSQTWQVRGFVYRKMETAENIEPRDIAIESFVQARNLDEEGKYTEQINGFLDNTIIRYYNDAVQYLQKGMLTESEDSYKAWRNKQKKYLNRQESDFTKRDNEYYDALGSGYLQRVDQLSGDEKKKNIEKAIHVYNKVLAIDSMQYAPNLNIGIMYYNQGADLITNMDPLTPIEDIPAIEEKAQNDFKKALPYLLRAHEMKPEKIDVIEAITGCYFGLYGSNNENYIKYQTILDEKTLPSLLEAHKKDPNDRETLKQLVRIYSTTFKDEEKYLEFSKKLNNLDG